MNKTINRSHVSEVNLRIVLNTISSLKETSKAELSRKLKLSKPNISESVEYLIQNNLISSLGLGKATDKGGRKPELLSFNKVSRFLIAIDLNLTSPVIALVNLAGEFVNEVVIKVPLDTPTKKRFTLISDAIHSILSEKEVLTARASSIGISTPGVVGKKRAGEYILNSQFLKWDIDNLSKHLGCEFNLPVFVKNDTNSAALGELYYGVGRKFTNILYVSCGLGLGAGIIVDSKLLEGKSDAAGEIGSFITSNQLKLKTKLESLVSIDWLLQQINGTKVAETGKRISDLAVSNDSLDLYVVYELWQGGDPTVVEAINQIGIELGCAIANIISLLNCEIVILGGEYLLFEKQLLPIICTIVAENAFVGVNVIPSSLGRNAGIFGLLSIFKEELFSGICKRSG